MQKQGRGRVVNLIGNDGVKPSYWEIAPGAANAAGQNLTLALAAQYGKDDISFVAVNPGPVRTERWAGLASGRSRPRRSCGVAEGEPAGRHGAGGCGGR
jgi:3-oxoacyl-[acyl-carrier protein] reductase